MTAPGPALSSAELERYARHIVLPEIGIAGQARLARARVLVAGMGGLGSPVALYLAGAGIGTLGLVDHDVVELSNLQRQILHGTATVGQPKVASALARLGDLNDRITLIPHHERITAETVLDLVRGYDIVVDGTDNLATRYLLNDAAVITGKTYVSGAVQGFEGQLGVFHHDGGPCYRCLFPAPPPPGMAPDCAAAGVLGVVPGLIGVMMAAETVKLVLGLGTPLAGEVMILDVLGFGSHRFRVPRDPACPICGIAPADRRLLGGAVATDHVGDAAPDRATLEVGPDDAVRLVAEAGAVLLDVREPGERQICALDGAVAIPLGALAARADTLASDRPIIAFCRSGVRSLAAARMLRARGFADCVSLAGGILAWRERIDPTLAPY